MGPTIMIETVAARSDAQSIGWATDENLNAFPWASMIVGPTYLFTWAYYFGPFKFDVSHHSKSDPFLNQIPKFFFFDLSICPLQIN